MFCDHRFTLIFTLSALAAVSACTPVSRIVNPAPFNQVAPARALADIRGHNGYYSMKNVAADSAKLVVRNVGLKKEAQFAMTTSVETCSGLQPLGITFDAGRGKNSPNEAYKILKKQGSMTEYVVRDLTPGQSVIVRGIGYWSSDEFYGNSRFISSGRCGPLYSRFTPLAGHAYLVQFEQPGTDCAQRIYDAADPDNLAPIPSEPVSMCPVEIE